MKFKLPLLASVFAIFLFTNQAFSTHVRSGQIRVQQIVAGDLTCKITIQIWTNTKNTDVPVGGDLSYLNFGDGSKPVLVPEVNNVVIDAFRGIAYAEYTIEHQYAGPGKYVVSYVEPNRNVGVLNMFNSGESTFYLETSFVLDPLSTKAYATPEFLAPPVFFGSASLGYSFSLAVTDVNDYTLFYQLSVPRQDRQHQVSGYEIPSNLAVNPFNGLITWDGKFREFPGGAMGEFTVAVKIYQLHEARKQTNSAEENL